MEELEIKLARKIVNGAEFCDGIRYNDFDRIYPYTNENLKEAFDELCYLGSKVLTVCGSGDHVLNAILYDCKDITVFDINRFSLYFLYLKLAAIMSFSLEEFVEFMPGMTSLNNQQGKQQPNKSQKLDIGASQILKENLKNISMESYEFWSKLCQKNPNRIANSPLFYNNVFNDNSKDNTIILTNYLNSNENYLLIKNKLSAADLDVKTIHANITKLPEVLTESNFDFIHLSNIVAYAREVFPTYITDDLLSTSSFSDFIKTNIYPLLSDNSNIILNVIPKTKIDYYHGIMSRTFYDKENPLLKLDLKNGDRVYYKRRGQKLP